MKLIIITLKTNISTAKIFFGLNLVEKLQFEIIVTNCNPDCNYKAMQHLNMQNEREVYLFNDLKDKI
jgi:hypothetical protein